MILNYGLFGCTLKLLKKPDDCGMAKPKVLQCSNGECKACTELPTSQRVVREKARFYDVNRTPYTAYESDWKRKSSFGAVMNVPGPIAKKSFNTHVKAIGGV